MKKLTNKRTSQKLNVKLDRAKTESEQKEKLVTSLGTLLKELSLRTLAVAIWDTLKGYIGDVF